MPKNLNNIISESKHSFYGNTECINKSTGISIAYALSFCRWSVARLDAMAAGDVVRSFPDPSKETSSPGVSFGCCSPVSWRGELTGNSGQNVFMSDNHMTVLAVILLCVPF